jgi:hypothetical protein
MYRHDVYRTGCQFGMQTGIYNPPPQVPYRISMKSYPNPFNASTTIEFTLPEESEIELAIYDILGRRIANLFTGQKEAGSFSFIWDAGDKPSGVYLASLKSKEYSKAVKILLLR